MELEKNVKPHPFWWKKIPIFNRHRGTTIWKYIFLTEEIYQDLKNKNPQPENVAVLIHEQIHVKRFSDHGFLKSALKYWFFPKFRFNEELIANKEAFRYLKKAGVEVDLEKKAKILSGFYYLFPVSYKKALKELKQTWNKI